MVAAVIRSEAIPRALVDTCRQRGELLPVCVQLPGGGPPGGHARPDTACMQPQQVVTRLLACKRARPMPCAAGSFGGL
jgi:hypothetical protein